MGDSENVVIPEEVTEISDKAFAGCINLKGVIIPETITTFGKYIFKDCINLKTICISDNILQAEYPFDGCTKLKDICYIGQNSKIALEINENGEPVNYVVHYGHTEVIDYEIPSTYYDTGLSTGLHCMVCNAIIVKQNVIPKKTLGKTDVYSIQNSNSGITIKWNKVDDATGYYIYRNGKQLCKISNATTLKYTDKSAVNGKKYVYSIRAIAVGIQGGKSQSKTMVRLSTQAISSLKSTAKKKLSISWNKNGKSDGYQIKITLGNTTKQYTIKDRNIITKLLSSLKSGKTYSVSIRSYRKLAGVTYYSGWSSAKKCKVK